jgi:hypothetical protein
MQKTKEPIVPTVNGKAQLVVQDVESYRALLEAEERLDAIAGVKRGREAMQSAKGKSANEFFAEFFAEHNIAGRLMQRFTVVIARKCRSEIG